MLSTLLVISGVVSCLRSFSYTLNSLNEDDYSSSGVTFAIYLNDGTDNYVEYVGDTFPAKADGYKYNSDISNCTDLDGNNSSSYSLYYNNDMVQVSTQESVYCYIYFDMYSYDGDYCLVNGITDNLGECALVMDDYSYTVEAAKEAIEEKGEATTNAISPTITYGSVYSETSSSGCLYSNALSTIYSKYSFSTSTGMYTYGGIVTSIDTETDYTGYYAGGNTTMYEILEYTITEGSVINYICIKKANLYTYSTNDSIESENGIYSTTDYDGSTTYFYRGSVKNNYVYFAGYYWRIIRVNGDGSVRMIYAGIDVNDTSDDQIGTSYFNSTNSDPTYVGYKYGDVSDTPIVQESTINYTNISANSEYYYGTSYEEVGDGTFKLKDDGLIRGTFYELFGPDGDYEDSITNYYTCFSTSKTGTCTLLQKLNAYNGIASANVYYISYASTSYEDTLTNKYDSTIKIAIDNWYEENIKGKYDEDGNGTHLLSEYISTSATFCGDRSVYSGDGYSLLIDTNYNSYLRLRSTYNPSLKCTNSEDLYSVDNGNLDYPVALITADEVALAGGKYQNNNTLFYLYTGSQYWTMTPYSFSSNGKANVWNVTSGGSLIAYWVKTSYGVRPVINLSSSVKISQGTGTASNPFVVTLD